MKTVLAYEIGGCLYSRYEIKNMLFEELKVLLSIIDNEKDLLQIAEIHSSDAVLYVNELLRTLK